MSAAKIESCSRGWRKARRSMGAGDCIEISPVVGGILVRDSKNPDGTVLRYQEIAWRSFLSAAKQGRLDTLRLLFYVHQQGARRRTVVWYL